jgi:hypothetical protein
MIEPQMTPEGFEEARRERQRAERIATELLGWTRIEGTGEQPSFWQSRDKLDVPLGPFEPHRNINAALSIWKAMRAKDWQVEIHEHSDGQMSLNVFVPACECGCMVGVVCVLFDRVAALPEAITRAAADTLDNLEDQHQAALAAMEAPDADK